MQIKTTVAARTVSMGHSASNSSSAEGLLFSNEAAASIAHAHPARQQAMDCQTIALALSLTRDTVRGHTARAAPVLK